MIEVNKISYYNGLYIKYEWSTQSFNKRTGNMCTRFKPNHFSNEVI